MKRINIYLTLLLPIILLAAACSKVAIWDGEKLMLGDENGEPVVIDITNSEESGIAITSIDKDGTMTIETTESKAPKVGDYLCSGSTERAPYGFMLRVTEVTKTAETNSTRSWDDIKV